MAIGTVAFPLVSLIFTANLLSHIPLLGIAAGLYGLLVAVFGAITEESVNRYIKNQKSDIGGSE